MIHLRSITLGDVPPDLAATFPFRVPSIRSLAGTSLEFESEVTFLVGENGSGKSTLLEALAIAARSISVGSDDLDRDATLGAVRALAGRLKLSWSKLTRRGFFMRSEDFFGFARRIQQIRDEAEADLRAIRDDTARSEYARGLASQPHARTLHELRRRYGEGLDAVSHGESFFTLFRSRFVPNGLYLLDEPEAPLSPKRQLGFISMLKTLTAEQGAQFVIATHSPILMAFPGATIWSFDEGRVRRIAYDDVEHVSVTRDFLRHPESFLRHL